MIKFLASLSLILSLEALANSPKPSDFIVTEWAKDDRLKNGVSISLDHQGKVYVSQTQRRKVSSLDLRHRREMVKDDLSFETVSDRQNYYHQELNNQSTLSWLMDRNEDGKKDWKDLTVQKDSVYQITDNNNDGKADQFHTLGEYHTEVTGIAGGVLALDDQVIVAAEPDVISYRDLDGDGKFEDKKVISTGYSVHIGQGGHNLSGLALGPDGRVYWSLADKGHSVTTKEGRRFHNPNNGGIFRCELDGSQVELFALGVRNAQELAFDQYGNLFSMDNDGDYPGEKERALYITEGSMHGWRLNWQWLKTQDFIKISGLPYYNPWMEEKLFLPDHETHAAYLTPTIGNFGPGPCGFTSNPGTALSPSYSNSFFMTNNKNEVRVFQFKEDGASFKFEESQAIPGGARNTGLAIGPDGALYSSSYGGGGAVYKFDLPKEYHHPLREETLAYLQQNFNSLSIPKLKLLLGHADQRVRVKAQIELSKKGEQGLKAFQDIIETQQGLTQLHGIFGVGMMSRKTPKYLSALKAAWQSNDPEILSLAAKTVGDVGKHSKLFHQELLKQLHHSSDRVVFFSAIALGHRGHSQDTQALISFCNKRANQSPYLRHAAIMGLKGTCDASTLASLSKHPNRTLRLSAIVALRRQASPEVSAFLNDQDELVLLEAARAIHDDHSIPRALSDLAQLLKHPHLQNEALMRRVINAAFRNGSDQDLDLLCNYLLHKNIPTKLQQTAFASILWWQSPPVLDAVEGRYRKHAPRAAQNQKKALQKLSQKIQSEEHLQLVLLNGIQVLKQKEWFKYLDLDFSKLSKTLKIAYIKALGETNHSELKAKLQLALAQDQSSQIKNEALKYASQAGIPLLDTLVIILNDDKNPLQNQALKQLAALKNPEAKDLFDNYVKLYREGNLNPNIQLDLYELAKSNGYDISPNLSMYEHGGDPRKGKSIFNKHASAQCTRCHLGNKQAKSIGPNLSKIGKQHNRSYLVDSLLNPNKDIAMGYGMAMISTKKGESFSGLLIEKTEQAYTLKLQDNSEKIIPIMDIKSSQLSSAMPPMNALLKPMQIRDVVSYLASLK